MNCFSSFCFSSHRSILEPTSHALVKSVLQMSRGQGHRKNVRLWRAYEVFCLHLPLLTWESLLPVSEMLETILYYRWPVFGLTDNATSCSVAA